MKLTEKGRATLKMALDNERSGGVVQCGCEGGDSGWDDEAAREVEYWEHQAASLEGKSPEDLKPEEIQILDALASWQDLENQP